MTPDFSKKQRKTKTIYNYPAGQKGRKEIVIDHKKFEELCKLQCTEIEICGVLNVSDETLCRWCRKNYGVNFSVISKVFRGQGAVSLRRRQFINAMSGDSKMLIWLGRNWLGQTDKQGDVEDDEPPAPTEIIIQGYDASTNNKNE